MKNFIKHYSWFIKESCGFMGKPLYWVILHGSIKAVKFAVSMCKWDRLSPRQREAWYLSGEGRLVEL